VTQNASVNSQFIELVFGRCGSDEIDDRLPKVLIMIARDLGHRSGQASFVMNGSKFRFHGVFDGDVLPERSRAIYKTSDIGSGLECVAQVILVEGVLYVGGEEDRGYETVRQSARDGMGLPRMRSLSFGLAATDHQTDNQSNNRNNANHQREDYEAGRRQVEAPQPHRSSDRPARKK
jgi:hypothetical protein